MNVIEYIERKKLEARINNIKEVRNCINEQWVKTKINNHIKRFPDLDYNDIITQIIDNDIVASFFCKDPNKQNISEKLCSELIGQKKLKEIVRFNKNGDVVSKNGVDETKSADYYINGYYITQKYTNENGGAQDNQFNDVVDFLSKGSIKHKVGALLDGHYWISKSKLLKKKFENNKNIIIFSIEDYINGTVIFK